MDEDKNDDDCSIVEDAIGMSNEQVVIVCV